MMHSFGDAISMANIAQAFNVLQALAFTKGPKMNAHSDLPRLQPVSAAYGRDGPQDTSGIAGLHGQITPSIPVEMQDWVITTTGGRREFPSEYLSASRRSTSQPSS